MRGQREGLRVHALLVIRQRKEDRRELVGQDAE